MNIAHSGSFLEPGFLVSSRIYIPALLEKINNPSKSTKDKSANRPIDQFDKR